jgi:hypothetical protein
MLTKFEKLQLRTFLMPRDKRARPYMNMLLSASSSSVERFDIVGTSSGIGCMFGPIR